MEGRKIALRPWAAMRSTEKSHVAALKVECDGAAVGLIDEGVVIVKLLLAAAFVAFAQTPTSGSPAQSVRVAAETPPLYQLGDDVLRFMASPALGGKAYVIEVHRVRDGSAEGEGIWLEGHPQLGWTRVGATKIKLTTTQYDGLAAEIDRALAPPPSAANQPTDLAICTDGPGWFTERKQKDMVWTLSGFCGSNHPNKRIAKAMQALFPEHQF